MIKKIKRVLKKIINEDNKGRPWMKINDKVKTITILHENKKRFCAPHRIPHKLPFLGKKISDEECHIHKSLWRDSHHIPFCKMLGYKNYHAMLNARGGFKQIK